MIVDLRDSVRTLRKRWALVAVTALLVLAAAAALTALATKQYTSTATLFVSTRDDGGGIADVYQGGLFTQQRVKSYAAVADSPAVTDRVATRLQIPTSELAGKVAIDAPLGTVLINVAVTDDSPTRARAIAAAVADEISKLIPSLETPPGEAVSPLKVTVTKQASVPGAPSSPRPKITLLLGLFLGLGLGVGVAVLVENLDTTVKGKDDLRKLTGSAPLGVIVEDTDVPNRPLVVQVGSQSPRAESFRQLRTNLQYADVDRPIRSLVMTSAISGEGKSTTSANLAITMAEAGLRTVLIEADLRRPKINEYMGVENAIGLTSVLSGNAVLRDALQPWGRHGLMVLPSGPLPPNPSEILGSQQMVDLLVALTEIADVVVMDAPPLLPVTDAAVLARIADGAVLVVQAGRTKREQVTRCLEALDSVDSRLLGTVVNRAPQRGPDSDTYGAGQGYGYYAAADADHRPVLVAANGTESHRAATRPLGRADGPGAHQAPARAPRQGRPGRR